jgi:hypothetical protein
MKKQFDLIYEAVFSADGDKLRPDELDDNGGEGGDERSSYIVEQMTQKALEINELLLKLKSRMSEFDYKYQKSKIIKHIINETKRHIPTPEVEDEDVPNIDNIPYPGNRPD